MWPHLFPHRPLLSLLLVGNHRECQVRGLSGPFGRYHVDLLQLLFPSFDPLRPVKKSNPNQRSIPVFQAKRSQNRPHGFLLPHERSNPGIHLHLPHNCMQRGNSHHGDCLHSDETVQVWSQMIESTITNNRISWYLLLITNDQTGQLGHITLWDLRGYLVARFSCSHRPRCLFSLLKPWLSSIFSWLSPLPACRWGKSFVSRANLWYSHNDGYAYTSKQSPNPHPRYYRSRYSI